MCSDGSTSATIASVNAPSNQLHHRSYDNAAYAGLDISIACLIREVRPYRTSRFYPRPRLKSRRPIWSNLPDEAHTIQHLWRTRWQNQIVDVTNKSLINDPTIHLPGMDLPRGQWSLLNRFRSDAEPCRNSMHECGYIASPLCDCGEHQTMRHIVNECPLTCFDGGISELHQTHDAAFTWLWLLRQNLRS